MSGRAERVGSGASGSRRILVALVISSSIASAGCGGHSAQPTTSHTRQRTSPHSSQALGAGGGTAGATPICRSLHGPDVVAVGAASSARVEPLASTKGSHLTCSALFIDAAGGIILELTETRGSPRLLAETRRAAQATLGRVRPLTDGGPGFIASRELAFLRHGRLVTLNTGYTTSGQVQLTSTQLMRLASLIARRS